MDPVELKDVFEFNPCEKGGALVEARYGKGRWIYVVLGLWRQLPAATASAYQLFAKPDQSGQGTGLGRSRDRR